MSDGWEVSNSLNPTNSVDASYDSDSDGLTSVEEYQNNTNPNNSDTDADGMPDGWEVDNNLDPRDYSANDDTGNDGQSDYEEVIITGMSPTNAASVFDISAFSTGATNAVLQWPSVTGRLYDVWFSSNLLDGFVPVQSNLPAGESGFVEYTNNTSGQTGFYRIYVRKP